MWFALRKFLEVGSILAQKWRHYVAMDLKPRTSKNALFFFVFFLTTIESKKEPSTLFFSFSWVTIEGYTKLKIFQ